MLAELNIDLLSVIESIPHQLLSSLPPELDELVREDDDLGYTTLIEHHSIPTMRERRIYHGLVLLFKFLHKMIDFDCPFDILPCRTRGPAMKILVPF